MQSPAITCHDLTKLYGLVRGIEALDLQVEQGEIFGFLGPNGAGKTTTIRLLLDLIRPTRGVAAVLGHHCRRDSMAARRSVGYLPGEYNLYENLRGDQLLAYLGALRGGYDPSFVGELAERLGADLTKSVSSLSHGNKQKLGLIQAFAPRPEVLILDEPTSGLDPLVRRTFLEMLDEVRREGRTVFLSSHDLSEVEKICDRIASVREGRLIAVESMAELRRRTLRIIHLDCERAPQPSAFADLDGIDDLDLEGRSLDCRVHGPLGPLLAAAAPFGVIDVTSRRPNLEEFFLALYGDEREVSRD